MRIPPFNTSGVLPPHHGPTDPSNRSPYLADPEDVVSRFATSRERRTILAGYLDYRRALRAAGFVGYQWLDGSFVEDIERTQRRPPNDVDVVTFYQRPATAPKTGAWERAHVDLFIPTTTKASFKCDAYAVCVDEPDGLVELTTYWHGLFSHRRDGTWKGMIKVPLPAVDNDQAARRLLAGAWS